MQISRPARALALWPLWATRGDGQEILVGPRRRKTSQPQKKLRFAKAAEVFEIKIQKGGALDPCQSCSREEGYRRNPRPPTSDERLVAALQAAGSLRCEVMEVPEVDIGVPPDEAHAIQNDGQQTRAIYAGLVGLDH